MFLPVLPGFNIINITISLSINKPAFHSFFSLNSTEKKKKFRNAPHLGVWPYGQWAQGGQWP